MTTILTRDVERATRLHRQIEQLFAAMAKRRVDAMTRYESLSAWYYGLGNPDRSVARELLFLRLAGVDLSETVQIVEKV